MLEVVPAPAVVVGWPKSVVSRVDKALASALTTVKTLISARIVGGMSNCLIRASISGMVSTGPATRIVLADGLDVRWTSLRTPESSFRCPWTSMAKNWSMALRIS